MYAFTFHRPETLRQAVSLLSKNADAKLLAGGHTLLPTMKLRLAGPPQLIDLSRVEGLAGIELKGRSLQIGAMTRHADVHDSAVVQEALPVLAKLAGMIGDPAVRHMGTIGGSVANNDPSADYPAAVLALDATVVTDRREIAADAFFRGLFTTALEGGEIITSLRFPVPAAGGYAKFKSPASRYAVVGVCVAQTAGKVRVAVTGAGPCVFRVGAMETVLEIEFTPDAIAAIKLGSENLSSDIHADADYRAHLVTVMAKKAVKAALQIS